MTRNGIHQDKNATCWEDDIWLDYYYDKEIFFIHPGIVGGIVAHYHILSERPNKKLMELNKMTCEVNFVDGVGTNPQSHCKIDKIYL